MGNQSDFDVFSGAHQSTINQCLNILDYIAARVTISTALGLGGGATYATYIGLPLRSSLSAGLSCALISTALFSMERVAYGVLQQCNNRKIGMSILGDDSEECTNVDTASHAGSRYALQSTPSPYILYGSYGLGGLFGGGIVGFLFQGKPIKGAFFFTPLMLMAGLIEVSLNNYRAERIQQILQNGEHESK